MMTLNNNLSCRKIRKVRSEELKAVSGELKCGDKILLSGVVYTARDAAHKRFNALLDEGKGASYPFERRCYLLCRTYSCS